MIRYFFRALPALFLFSCAAKEELVRIGTPLGDIWFRFHPQTPRHREAFMRLASQHYWDSLCFNRVIPEFVAQGGCPDTPEGFGNSPHLLDPEFDASLKHVYGAVGAGRDNNPEMRSAACQFYIVQNKNGIPRLNGKYTVFGQVISGMNVVDSICNSTRDTADNPVIRIPTSIRIQAVSKGGLKKLMANSAGMVSK
jgi:peptidyl-prolyl cis-trans isomerase B (cyclophilin B)